MKLSSNSSETGTSLIEATIASCTAALFLGSLFTMNMSAMRAVRTAREASSASQVLQQRVETLRIANWQQITNANWITANLLNANAVSADKLNAVSETLTLTPYNGTTTTSTQIVRSNGTNQVVSQNTALLKESAVKVIWKVAYTTGGKGGITTRQTVAILAKGGVAKW